MRRQAPSLGPSSSSPERRDPEIRPDRGRSKVVDDAPSKKARPKKVPKRSRRKLGARRILISLLVVMLCLTVVPVVLLRFVPAWTSSFMLQYQVSRVFSEAEKPALQHRWIEWERIAPAAKLAVIAAEDQRFADHFGVDFKALGKAIKHNRTNHRTRGASTITQQTAKNLFLWPRRSWFRKGLELGYTLLIELAWSKQRVLEVYLNIVEFGPGVYGVEAASQTYFAKSADKLTYHEAALLAAVLPNPKRFKVAAPSLYVQNRAIWIRKQMNQIGVQQLGEL